MRRGAGGGGPRTSIVVAKTRVMAEKVDIRLRSEEQAPEGFAQTADVQPTLGWNTEKKVSQERSEGKKEPCTRQLSQLLWGSKLVSCGGAVRWLSALELPLFR